MNGYSWSPTTYVTRGKISNVAMLLKKEIMSKASSLGSTAAGADWCLKALHPADPLVEVRGLPDKSAVPSAFVNYQSAFTISPAAGSTGTWTVDVSLLPDPVAFLSIGKTDSTGATNSLGLNSQLTGATYDAKAGTLTTAIQRWRLVYAGMTIVQDGPDLANQGTVVCIQKPCMPGVSAFGTLNGTQADVGNKSIFYGTEDAPDYDSSMAMPNAYFNQSKYGVYAPMKLTRTCQNWRDLYIHVSRVMGQSAVLHGAGAYTLPGATSANTTWPYYGVNQDSWSAAAGRAGSAVFDWGNDVCVQACFRNMAVTTSLSVYVRFGIEVQCQASSIYAPQLRLSPPHDALAIQTYFAIAREMKDGYPADYNDLGKIWSVIKEAVRRVGPWIGLIPHPIAKGVSTALGTGLDVVESIEKSVRSKADGRGAPPAATVEAARNIITNSKLSAKSKAIAKKRN